MSKLSGVNYCLGRGKTKVSGLIYNSREEKFRGIWRDVIVKRMDGWWAMLRFLVPRRTLREGFEGPPLLSLVVRSSLGGAGSKCLFFFSQRQL